MRSKVPAPLLIPVLVPNTMSGVTCVPKSGLRSCRIAPAPQPATNVNSTANSFHCVFRLVIGIPSGWMAANCERNTRALPGRAISPGKKTAREGSNDRCGLASGTRGRLRCVDDSQKLPARQRKCQVATGISSRGLPPRKVANHRSRNSMPDTSEKINGTARLGLEATLRLRDLAKRATDGERLDRY